MVAIFSIENPLFASYGFHASLLILKTILMGILTVRERIKNKVFPSQEDYSGMKDHEFPEKPHPDVERIRKAHLNDLENILPFLIIGLLFIATEPKLVIAQWMFHIFTVARFVHSFAYVNAVAHKIRGISYIIGTFINISMGVMCAIAFGKHVNCVLH